MATMFLNKKDTRWSLALLCCLLLLTVTTCKKGGPQSVVPYVDVYFNFYPQGMDNTLAPVGGSKNFDNYGYNGVVVIHTGVDEYTAFDRACPNDYLSGCQVQYVGGYLQDKKCCNSMFDEQAGYPINSLYPNVLRQYKVYQIDERTFAVSN